MGAEATDSAPLQLNIDSCWVGSFYCPQASFTATIYDAIATESTLFIRQNQLVYYFTGTYLTLHESNRGSGEGPLASQGRGPACGSPREGTPVNPSTGSAWAGISMGGEGVLEGLSEVLDLAPHPTWPSPTLSMLG